MGDGTIDVAFVALARNCERRLHAALAALARLESRGLRVLAIVGENGSTDRTRRLLESAQVETTFVHLVDTSFMAKTPTRLERMARGRQFLLQRVPSNARAVGVVDLDEPFLEAISAEQLEEALTKLDAPDVFGVAATSRPTYYDLLAYEDQSRNFVGLEERIKATQANPVTYYRLFRDVVYPEQERLTSAVDLECISAFNGLALYATADYVKGSYLYEGEGPWPCEHVSFNRSLGALTAGHMVIDAQLVLPMPAEHGRRSAAGFMWQRAVKAGRLLKSQSGP